MGGRVDLFFLQKNKRDELLRVGLVDITLLGGSGPIYRVWSCVRGIERGGRSQVNDKRDLKSKESCAKLGVCSAENQ